MVFKPQRKMAYVKYNLRNRVRLGWKPPEVPIREKLVTAAPRLQESIVRMEVHIDNMLDFLKK